MSIGQLCKGDLDMFFNRFKPEKAHEELKNWLGP